MTSPWSETSIISTLALVAAELNRYLSIVILLFGTVGNLLNCLALSQRLLRSNPCALLFLGSSVASLITLISGVAVRLLSGWNADLTATVAWICKARIFVLYVSRTVALWLITLATIDRWLATSMEARRRQWSSVKNARRGISFLTLVSFLVWSHVLYCLDANMINSPVRCYGRTEWCRMLADVEFISVNVLMPLALMLIFGLLTISNVRQSALRRIQPASRPIQSLATENNSSIHPSLDRSKKVDRYMLAMLLLQVILLTLFCLPQAIHNLYSIIIRTRTTSPLHNAISSFILNLFFLLTYVSNGMPFYIYTLTGGNLFRKALLDAIKHLITKICGGGRR